MTDYLPHGWTAFDGLVIVVIALSVVTAFFRGFFKEFFTLLALLGAIFASFHLSFLTFDIVKKVVPHDDAANAFSSVLVFLIAALILGFTGKMLAALFRGALSAPLDHLLGVFFGFFRGLLLVLIPFLFVHLYLKPETYPSWLEESKTYPMLEETSELIEPLLPENILPVKLPDIQENAENDMKLLEHTTKAPEKDIHKKRVKTGYSKEERQSLDTLVQEQTQK